MSFIYYNNKHELLKYKFNDCEKIEKNFSQSYQDIFVLTMLNGKRDGIFVEIGASDSIFINNTYLLEKYFNWNGISIDITIASKFSFEKNRKCNFVHMDALKINYEELFEKYKLPKQIDYLQIDIDPPVDMSLDCLKRIPLDKYRFSVITFEHNIYLGSNLIKVREESRKIFKQFNYELLVGDISNDSINDPFEDWYIDKSMISLDILNIFNSCENFKNTGEKFLLNI